MVTRDRGVRDVLFDEDSAGGFDVAAADERIRRTVEALGLTLVPAAAR